MLGLYCGTHTTLKGKLLGLLFGYFNAYKKASQNNGKVISANVSLKTSICPECGRSYVAGGETRTQIKYYNEDNPYQQDKKATDGLKYIGMNINAAC